MSNLEEDTATATETATTTTTTANSSNTVDLDSMSLEQLHQLRQQEDERLQGLTHQYSQLRQAAARISASQRAVQEVSMVTKDQAKQDTIMVPLTESVYVPGRICNPDQFMVELGTGYYVEQSADDTVSYLNRKKKLVDTNSDNITSAIQQTRQNLEQISTTMRGKMLEIRARQEGARHRATIEGDHHKQEQ